ncbi:putative phosphoethanolamine transferase YbiP [compost metagenome]
MMNIKEKFSLMGVLWLFYLFFYTFLIFRNDEKFVTLLLIFFFSYIFSLACLFISKLLYNIFLIFLGLVCLFYYPFVQEFQKLEESHVTSLFFTNIDEAKSYLKLLSISGLIKTFLLFSPLFYFYNYRIVQNRKLGFSLFFGVLLFVFFKGFSRKDDILKDHRFFYKTIYVAPARVVVNFFVRFYLIKKDLDFQKELRLKKDSWKIISSDPEKEVYVFVIGESVRRDFMGIYNSKFRDTSFLDNVKRIQFQNVISFAPNTSESLSYCFIEKNQESLFFPNNIVSLSKKAGFAVNWISNQGSVGRYDSNIASIAKLADYNKFLTNGNYGSYKNDKEMLDFFRERIKQETKQKKMFFLHTIGSHPSPCDITKDQYSKFYKSKDLSCYLESIKRTDEFIGKLYQDLVTSKKSFKLVYFSDHGLYINENNKVLHHSMYKESYEIPMFVLEDNLSQTKYINANRNLRDFLSFFCEITNIKVEQIKTNYQFLSEEIDPDAYNLYEGKNFKQLKTNKN